MPKEFVPQVVKSKRVNNPMVACKMPEDVIEPFYALCTKTGLSPSRLCGQMIRYAIENMKEGR